MTDVIKALFKDLYVEKYGEHITKDIATDLVLAMSVTDGSSRTDGQKWTLEEAVSVGDKAGVSWEKVRKSEWYLVLNMMYSDFYRTAKRHNSTDAGFFADLAYDWFYDVDGNENKTFCYFMQL